MFRSWHFLPGAAALLLLAACAVSAAPVPVPAASDAGGVTTTNPLAAVAYFRRLLSATPAERARLLAGKPAPQLRVLTNSLRTYLALPAAERELRLRAMELRTLLTPLLRLAPAERAARLSSAPAAYRPVLEERLAYWDRLPPHLQQQVLEEERATRFGSSRALVGDRPAMPPVPLGDLSPARQAALAPVLTPWQATTPARQRDVITAFTNLFDQPGDQRNRRLDPLPLSAEERALIEKALEAFRRLEPLQRQACVNGFKKFAELSPAERVQFLRNAEAWQKMSPEDRQRWRDLVNHMPPLPPLPPGFGVPPLPPVPRPPAVPSPASAYVSNSPPAR